MPSSSWKISSGKNQHQQKGKGEKNTRLNALATGRQGRLFLIIRDALSLRKSTMHIRWMLTQGFSPHHFSYVSSNSLESRAIFCLVFTYQSSACTSSFNLNMINNFLSQNSLEIDYDRLIKKQSYIHKRSNNNGHGSNVKLQNSSTLPKGFVTTVNLFFFLAVFQL